MGKIDLRDAPETIENLKANNQKPISTSDGERLAKEIGAAKYLECSALTQKGLPNVFEDAVKAVFADQKDKQAPGKKEKKGCTCCKWFWTCDFTRYSCIKIHLLLIEK